MVVGDTLEEVKNKVICTICGKSLDGRMSIRKSWELAGRRGFLPPLAHPECSEEEMRKIESGELDPLSIWQSTKLY
jgi:hypothetical protein